MFKQKICTLPILLTLARFVVIIPIVFAVLHDAWLSALLLLVCAGITDFLDGYFARAWGQETLLGACLDPLADKVLVVAVYATLLLHGVAGFTTPLWFLILIVARELVILLGAAVLGLMRHDIDVRPTLLGKLTTTAHLCFMTVLLLSALFDQLSVLIAPLFWLAAVLVIVSLAQYSYIGIRGIIIRGVLCSKK